MLDININLLWQFINFFIVLYVLNRFLFTPVGQVLKKRREDIDLLYKKIEEDREAAENFKKEHDEKLKKIQIEIEEIKRNAIKEGNHQRDEIIKEAHCKAQDTIDKGLVRIEIETKKELDKLQDYLSDLSIQIAAKILKEEIDINRHKTMIGDFIQKVGEKEWQKR